MKIELNKQKKSKRAISVLVGYVLLVTFSVVIGILVYKLLKTYVPQEDINCPDGTSFIIQNYTYDCNSKMFTMSILNNGKFDIGGYFVYGANSSDREVGTIGLASLNVNVDSRISQFGVEFGNLFNKNPLQPNNEETDVYNLTNFNGQLYLVQLVPIRWQTEGNKWILVSCKDAEIKKDIECS